MDLLRSHIAAASRGRLLGLVMLVAALASGCALYDAFTNDPEGENNGNNGGGDCSPVEVEGREDACLVECTRASEFTEVLDSPELNACEEDDVCVSLYENPAQGDGIEPINGVCLTRGEREACSQLSFQDFEDPGFEPCSDDSAQYHVAARPGGGFVVAGCRIHANATSGSGNGVRVLWLDEWGRLDGAPGDARTFIPIEAISAKAENPLDPNVQPTVLALEAVNGDSALITVRTQETSSTEEGSTLGITSTGSSDFGADVFWAGNISPCANGIDGGQHIVRAGDWFVVGSCFDAGDGPGVGFFVGELDATGGTPVVLDMQTSGVSITGAAIQDLSVPPGATDMAPGQLAARALLVDPQNLRLNSIPLSRDPFERNEQFRLGTDSGTVTDADSIVLPTQTGYEPMPRAASVLDTSNKPVSVAQGGTPVVPKIFPPTEALGTPMYGKSSSGQKEQALGLVPVGQSFGDVDTLPTPGDGSTTWALLSVVGSGDNASGRLYGLDSELGVDGRARS